MIRLLLEIALDERQQELAETMAALARTRAASTSRWWVVRYAWSRKAD